MEELNQLIVEVAKRLGYVLKEEQKTVITSFVLGQDVFVVIAAISYGTRGFMLASSSTLSHLSAEQVWYTYFP